MPKPLGQFGGEEPFITGLAGGTGAGSKEGGAGDSSEGTGSFGAGGGSVTDAVNAARESQDVSPEGGVGFQQATTFYAAPAGNVLTGSSVLSIGLSSVGYAYRFICLYTITVTKIAFEVVGAAAGNVGAALYDDSDSGARLMSTGAVSATSGVKSLTGLSPVTLIAGRSYRAYVGADVTGLTIQAHGNSFNGVFNTLSVIKGRAANAAPSGVPPATTGTITASGDILPFILVLSAE